MIYRVAAPDLSPLWPEIEPLVILALRGTPTHDAEDVRKTLLAGRAMLFIQHTGSGVEAVCITEFVAYPKGVWISAWLTAARPDVPIQWEEFQATIEILRRENGARGFEYHGGRPGWIKRMNNPAVTVEGISARLTVE